MSLRAPVHPAPSSLPASEHIPIFTNERMDTDRPIAPAWHLECPMASGLWRWACVHTCSRQTPCAQLHTASGCGFAPSNSLVPGWCVIQFLHWDNVVLPAGIFAKNNILKDRGPTQTQISERRVVCRREPVLHWEFEFEFIGIWKLGFGIFLRCMRVRPGRAVVVSPVEPLALPRAALWIGGRTSVSADLRNNGGSGDPPSRGAFPTDIAMPGSRALLPYFPSKTSGPIERNAPA